MSADVTPGAFQAFVNRFQAAQSIVTRHGADICRHSQGRDERI